MICIPEFAGGRHRHHLPGGSEIPVKLKWVEHPAASISVSDAAAAGGL